MRYGMVHTGNDLAPQMVFRVIRKERTEKDIAQQRYPYNLRPIPGTYRPDRPTPVDEIGWCPLDLARELDSDPSVPLKLVEIPDEDYEEYFEAAEADRIASKTGVQADRRLARADRSQESMDRANGFGEALGI